MRVMILSTKYTGLGHNSIASAINDALLNVNIDCKIFDMVDMCGRFVAINCKAYGKITNNMPYLWNIAYQSTNKVPKLINTIVNKSCKSKFIEAFLQYNPDCVVSVHPMFVGSVIDIIKSLKNDCKFVTVIADIVNINMLWLNTKADLTICPSIASRIIAAKLIDNSKLATIYIPTRAQIVSKATTASINNIASHSHLFYKYTSSMDNKNQTPARQYEIFNNNNYNNSSLIKSSTNPLHLNNVNTLSKITSKNPDNKIPSHNTSNGHSNIAKIKNFNTANNSITQIYDDCNKNANANYNNQSLSCIIISGGEGSGNITKYVERILTLQYTTVTIICGKNKKLYNICKSKYCNNNRIKIFGFVTDIASHIANSDVAIIRGSPNIIMECVTLLTPIIVIYTLPGQERDNDDFVQSNNLGLKSNLKNLTKNIESLVDNKYQLLLQIKQNQYNYRDLLASNKIANNIKQLLYSNTITNK